MRLPFRVLIGALALAASTAYAQPPAPQTADDVIARYLKTVSSRGDR